MYLTAKKISVKPCLLRIDLAKILPKLPCHTVQFSLGEFTLATKALLPNRDTHTRRFLEFVAISGKWQIPCQSGFTDFASESYQELVITSLKKHLLRARY